MELKAGAAKVKITPSEPIPLAGFYDRQGAFEGVHDNIFVRSVAFESDGTEAVVISVDICILSEHFVADVTGRIKKATGIPKNCVILNASHTHGGPALYEPPGTAVIDASFMDDNPYLENQKRYTWELKEKIVQSVSEARANRVPARIGFGRGQVSIGINRREQAADGDVWLGVNPDGPVDRDMLVARVDDAAGKPLAILFNHGTHGVSMMSRELTGDWCGIAAQSIEEEFGSDVVASFLSGAAGDVNSIYVATEKFDDPSGGAVELARIAADEVIDVAKDITTESTADVSAAQRVVMMPGKRYLGLLGFDPKYDEIAKDTSPVADTPLKMSVIKVGAVVFAGVNGEIFSEIGMEFKDKSPCDDAMFMGICNGYVSYIPTESEIERGGYEYNASVIKSGGQRVIVDTLVEMVRGS